MSNGRTWFYTSLMKILQRCCRCTGMYWPSSDIEVLIASSDASYLCTFCNNNIRCCCQHVHVRYGVRPFLKLLERVLHQCQQYSWAHSYTFPARLPRYTDLATVTAKIQAAVPPASTLWQQQATVNQKNLSYGVPTTRKPYAYAQMSRLLMSLQTAASPTKASTAQHADFSLQSYKTKQQYKSD